MKIVRVNAGSELIFDTDTLSVEVYTGSTRELYQLEPLHHTHALSDYEFLKQFFSEDHRIFFDFGNSFFYVID